MRVSMGNDGKRTCGCSLLADLLLNPVPMAKVRLLAIPVLHREIDSSIYIQRIAV